MYILPLAEVRAQDVRAVGGKAANLGELIRADMPVPDGFVITADAYERLLSTWNLREQIRQRLQALREGSATADVVSLEVQDLIRRVPIPEAVAEAIDGAYGRLRQSTHTDWLAVRSSAAVEDSANYSFAGLFRSTLNVAGEDRLLAAVRDCWASLFSIPVLSYMQQQNVMDELRMGIVVQEMIAADRSGVVSTADATRGDATGIVIEAVRGLREPVVRGDVNPDRYVVDKDALTIVARDIAAKACADEVNVGAAGTERVELNPSRPRAEVLDEQVILSLATFARRIENHFNCPQDIEWAVRNGTVFILQARAITTAVTRYPGVRSTAPELVPALRGTAAIIPNNGGITSHAAIGVRTATPSNPSPLR